MDRFVPRDDAKRQWGQSPEIEDWLRRMQSISTESMDEPITPRYAMSGFYIETGGFLYAAAIDARWRICPRRQDMAVGFHHRHDLASANATKKFRAGTLLRQTQQPVTALNSKL